MSKAERDRICEEIGDELGVEAKRRREIEEMSEEDIEAEIKRTEAAIAERVESATKGQGGSRMGKLLWLTMMLGIIGEQGKFMEAFSAYDCSNRSNIVESYLLLEPDACAVSNKTGEIETAVYGETMQMKQDWIIPIFPSLGDNCVAVLQSLVFSWSHAVHPIQGNKGSGSLGVQAGKVTWKGRHRGLQDPGHHRSHDLPCDVPQRCNG
jgi:hypothetical protein